MASFTLIGIMQLHRSQILIEVSLGQDSQTVYLCLAISGFTNIILVPIFHVQLEPSVLDLSLFPMKWAARKYHGLLNVSVIGIRGCTLCHLDKGNQSNRWHLYMFSLCQVIQ